MVILIFIVGRFRLIITTAFNDNMAKIMIYIREIITNITQKRKSLAFNFKQ